MPEKEGLRAVFLLGTLKKKGEYSHTEVLCEVLAEQLKKLQVESEIIRLAEYDIRPGTKTHIDDDDWPEILKKILAAQIVIFATPIWWGIQSSLTQRVIERMDELNDKLLETGKSDFADKIGGIVITGGEDGVQHIIGNITNFMSWNGFTVPPACSLTWTGEAPKAKEEMRKKFEESKPTMYMARTMAGYLVFFAKLLEENPIPNQGEGIMEALAPGTVGIRERKN